MFVYFLKFKKINFSFFALYYFFFSLNMLYFVLFSDFLSWRLNIISLKISMPISIIWEYIFKFVNIFFFFYFLVIVKFEFNCAMVRNIGVCDSTIWNVFVLFIDSTWSTFIMFPVILKIMYISFSYTHTHTQKLVNFVEIFTSLFFLFNVSFLMFQGYILFLQIYYNSYSLLQEHLFY